MDDLKVKKAWIIRREVAAHSEVEGTDGWSDRVETVRWKGYQGSQTEGGGKDR